MVERADVKKESYSVYSTGSITVDGGTLEGRGGAVTAAPNAGATAAISAGIFAPSVTVTGGFLTGIGNTATAADALSYGLYANTLTIQGGTTTANGGAAAGSGGGAYSAGVAAKEDLSVSGGLLKAQGGHATESSGAAAQSSGIYAKADSISFSGGTLTATSGIGSTSRGVVGFDGGSKIYVSGGRFTAIADTASGFALSRALTAGADITAKGSTSPDGSDPKPYVDTSNHSNKWVCAQPPRDHG